MKSLFLRLLKDEQGQDLVEYALIVAAIGLALIATVNQVSTAIVSLYQSIADLSLESRKRTARSPATRRDAHTGHEAIIAALSSRDADAAAAAMHDHLDVIQHALEHGEPERNQR